jgi:hypothetical protein
VVDVDPDVDPSPFPASELALDLAVRDSRREQLSARDDTVLRPKQLIDRTFVHSASIREPGPARA